MLGWLNFLVRNTLLGHRSFLTIACVLCYHKLREVFPGLNVSVISPDSKYMKPFPQFVYIHRKLINLQVRLYYNILYVLCFSSPLCNIGEFRSTAAAITGLKKSARSIIGTIKLRLTVHPKMTSSTFLCPKHSWQYIHLIISSCPKLLILAVRPNDLFHILMFKLICYIFERSKLYLKIPYRERSKDVVSGQMGLPSCLGRMQSSTCGMLHVLTPLPHLHQHFIYCSGPHSKLDQGEEVAGVLL